MDAEARAEHQSRHLGAGPPLVSREPRDMEMGSRDLFLQRGSESNSD